MLLPLVATAATGLRFTPPPHGLLPPAGSRDIAAEASAAAAAFRPSSVPLFQPIHNAGAPAARPLVLLTLVGEDFTQLVGEVVSEVTSGARAGTTWLRPLALRVTSNVTLAQSAFNYDPMLGWIGGGGEDSAATAVPSDIHLFSCLAPAAFIPSVMLESVPAALSSVVRSMSEAYAAEAEDLFAAGAPLTARDAAKVHELMRALAKAWPEDASSTVRSDATSGMYDPLGLLAQSQDEVEDE